MRTGSNPCDVSTTKSARLRFSASGNCRARMPSSASDVMVPRARIRSRWVPGRRDHDHGIDTFFAAGLEQQRDIHHHDRRAGPFGLLEEFLAGGAEHRMNDLLELFDGRRIVHHSWRTVLRDHPAIDGRAGKCRLDRGRRLALIDFVDGGIGVVNRHACLSEQLRSGGFSPSRSSRSVQVSCMLFVAL